MTIFWHCFHLAQIILAGFFCIKFWQLRRQGFLQDWYPRIGMFVASYGALIGGIIWYFQNYKFL